MSLCHLPQRLARPGEINHAFVDPMSLVHALVGIGLGLFRLGPFAVLGIAVGWEVVEHVLKGCFPGAFVYPTQDTLMNAAGDVVATMAGWWAARLYARRYDSRRATRRSRPSAPNRALRYTSDPRKTARAHAGGTVARRPARARRRNHRPSSTAHPR